MNPLRVLREPLDFMELVSNNRTQEHQQHTKSGGLLLLLPNKNRKFKYLGSSLYYEFQSEIKFE